VRLRTARSSHAELTQNDFQWAEAGEGRLQQIEPDKRGKPEPVNTLIVRQHEADEDKGPGESANNYFHNVVQVN